MLHRAITHIIGKKKKNSTWQPWAGCYRGEPEQFPHLQPQSLSFHVPYSFSASKFCTDFRLRANASWSLDTGLHFQPCPSPPSRQTGSHDHSWVFFIKAHLGKHMENYSWATQRQEAGQTISWFSFPPLSLSKMSYTHLHHGSRGRVWVPPLSGGAWFQHRAPVECSPPVCGVHSGWAGTPGRDDCWYLDPFILIVSHGNRNALSPSSISESHRLTLNH